MTETEAYEHRVRATRTLFWLLFLGMILLDQMVKEWVRVSLAVPGKAITVIPNVLDITLTFNKGVAFGMLQGAGLLLAPIAIAIAVGSMYYSAKHPKESLWTHAAMALLGSGALGNLYDRLFHGQVTDMFWVRFVNFPVFNVADSCITVAAAILILKWAKEAVKHEKSGGPRTHESPSAPSTETLPS